jgi:hypothetical protein
MGWQTFLFFPFSHPLPFISDGKRETGVMPSYRPEKPGRSPERIGIDA